MLERQTPTAVRLSRRPGFAAVDLAPFVAAAPCPRRYRVDTISFQCYLLAVSEVVVTDEFRDWYEALSLEEQESIFSVVSLLEGRGVALGRP